MYHEFYFRIPTNPTILIHSVASMHWKYCIFAYFKPIYPHKNPTVVKNRLIVLNQALAYFNLP